MFRSLLLLSLLPLSVLSSSIPINKSSLVGLGIQAINKGSDLIYGGVVQGEEDGTVTAMTRWSFSDCGSPGDAVIIKSLEVSPDPPQPGQKLTIKASGTVTETVDEGSYAQVLVKLGLVKLINKTFDVCEELTNANMTLSCPITPGDYEIETSVDLPREIPRAKFVVQMRSYTQNDGPLACADIMIDFILGHN